MMIEQAELDQHDVRLQLLDLLNGLRQIVGFFADPITWETFDQGTDPHASYFVVVRDENVQNRGGWLDCPLARLCAFHGILRLPPCPISYAMFSALCSWRGSPEKPFPSGAGTTDMNKKRIHD